MTVLILEKLEKYPEKINWAYLSGNPNTISLLEKNIDKIDWAFLSINPNAIPSFSLLKTIHFSIHD